MAYLSGLKLRTVKLTNNLSSKYSRVQGNEEGAD